MKRYNNPKDRGELRQILGDLESFFVRRAICELSTKNYNRFFVDMIKALHAANDFSAAAIRGHLTAQTGDSNRWPDDEEFKVCWMMVKFYRRLRNCRLNLMPITPKTWSPQHLVAVGKSFDTSVGTTEIDTDAGKAYLKPMGNRSGPHALACDWVATHIAQLVGLPTFEINLLVLGPSDVFPLPRSNMAAVGPAFVSRAMKGHVWGEGEEELESLANTDDISRMVVFDTWLLNCDRYPPDLTTRNPNPDNVFLADTDNVDLMKLIVSDHTHCFTCGRDLTDRTAEIYRVQDDRIYGLFPAFARFLQADIINDFCEVIRSVTRPDVEEVIGLIPTEWEVPSVARHAMADLILRRASFIADNVAGWLFP